MMQGSQRCIEGFSFQLRKLLLFATETSELNPDHPVADTAGTFPSRRSLARRSARHRAKPSSSSSKTGWLGLIICRLVYSSSGASSRASQPMAKVILRDAVLSLGQRLASKTCSGEVNCGHFCGTKLPRSATVFLQWCQC